jgi:hypothetical protein
MLRHSAHQVPGSTYRIASARAAHRHVACLALLLNSCSACNVTCTSHETLLGHAAGVKHKRKAKHMLGQQQQGAESADHSGAGQHSAPEPQQGQQQQPLLQVERLAGGDGVAKANGSSTSCRKTARKDKTECQAVGADSSSWLDGEGYAKLQKVVSKRLKEQGSVGPKKLKALSASRLTVPASGQMSDELLLLIREKVR